MWQCTFPMEAGNAIELQTPQRNLTSSHSGRMIGPRLWAEEIIKSKLLCLKEDLSHSK
jgi:hypothetical protein